MAGTVIIPALLSHQQPVADADAPNKLIRAGRRWGKTIFCFNVAIVGHGSKGQFRGIASGLDVVWVPPTIPQANLIWSSDIRPRFKGVEGVRVNEVEKTVRFEGGGTLWVRSAESIDSIRGIGKNLGGVVVDEGAWQDLEYNIQTVIRPALTDNEGWLVVVSTTNAGHDGNGDKVMPSYFNRLCIEVEAGNRGPDWAHFTGTAYDNPKLSRRAVDSMVSEYPADSLALKQEVYAELVEAGAGLAFPEFREAVHILPAEPTPNRRWTYYAGLDWGYNRGAYVLMGIGPDGELEQIFEYYDAFTGKHARQAAQDIAEATRHLPRPEYIMADEQMWSQIGLGNTLAEEYSEGLAKAYGGLENAPGLVQATHKSGSRVAKKNLAHKWLASTGEIGRQKPWERPRYRVAPSCRRTIDMWKKLPLDPKRPDDVDTTHVLDHIYDAVCFVFAARPEPPLIRLPVGDPDNTDAGIDWQRQRLREWEDRRSRSDVPPPVPGMPGQGFQMPGYGVVGAGGKPAGWTEGFGDEDA